MRGTPVYAPEEGGHMGPPLRHPSALFPGYLFGPGPPGVEHGSSIPRPGHPCAPRPRALRGRSPTGVIYRESEKNRGVPARASQIPGPGGGWSASEITTSPRSAGGPPGLGVSSSGKAMTLVGPRRPKVSRFRCAMARSLIRVRLSSRSDNSKALKIFAAFFRSFS